MCQEFYFLYKSQFEAGEQSCTVAYLGGTVQDEVKADKTICNSSKTEKSLNSKWFEAWHRNKKIIT